MTDATTQVEQGPQFTPEAAAEIIALMMPKHCCIRALATRVVTTTRFFNHKKRILKGLQPSARADEQDDDEGDTT